MDKPELTLAEIDAFEREAKLRQGEFLLGVIRTTIRDAGPAPGQTHWYVHGVGDFDLEGNPLDITPTQSID